MIILHQHARELGYCNRGMRQFCKRYGFDWMDFVKNGVDSAVLEKLDDAMAARLIEHARDKEKGQEK